MPSQKVASAYVDLQLQTAAFKAAIGEASGEMKKFSASMREESNKSRESVRLLSEELGLGIPRGLQGIISKLPGVTTAMNLAFDSVVVFALIDTVVKVTEKVVEFAKKSEEAAKKNSESWNEIDKSIRDTNSELTRSNAHIQESIAKLEHKPGDGMKNALLEAADAAQKLSEKLDQDLDKLLKLTTERKVGFLDELAGNGQDDLDRTIGYGAKKYREITPEYDADRNSAAARGDWKNYNQLGKDELAAVTRAVGPQIATIGDYLRQHQDLAISNPNDPKYAKAKSGYDTLTGLVSDMEKRNQGEQGKETETGLRIAKDAASQSKEADAAAKAAAEKYLKDFETRFKFFDALGGPTDAQMHANPGTRGHAGALETYKAYQPQREIDAIKDIFESGAKLSKPQQDLLNNLLRTLNTQLLENTQALKQRVEQADATALAGFNNKNSEIMTAEQSRVAESLKSLREAADKSAKSLLDAIGNATVARAKEQLRTGNITPSQFQHELIYGPGGIRDKAKQSKDENAQVADEKRQVILAQATEVEKKLTSSLNDYVTSVMAGRKWEDLSPEEKGFIDGPKGANVQFESDKAVLQSNRDQLLANLPIALQNANAAVDLTARTAVNEAAIAASQSQALGGIKSVFDEIKARSMDVGKQIHDIFTDALNSFNDTAIKVMTEHDHRGAWKEMGKSLFTGAAKTGLQDVEGQGFKAMEKIPGLGGLLSKLHPAKVQEVKGHVVVDNLAAGAILPGMSPVSGTSGESSTLSNIIGAVAPFIPMAGGGVMSPGDFYLTGEQGPELLQVGSTSRINNARDTSAILSNGGSGSATHNWNIDARGSNDPAAVNAAVQRGIAQAVPHIVAATHAAQKEHARRTPSRPV